MCVFVVPEIRRIVLQYLEEICAAFSASRVCRPSSFCIRLVICRIFVIIILVNVFQYFDFLFLFSISAHDYAVVRCYCKRSIRCSKLELALH